MANAAGGACGEKNGVTEVGSIEAAILSRPRRRSRMPARERGLSFLNGLNWPGPLKATSS